MMRGLFITCRNALAFLSRLVPPASHEPEALAAAVPCFPLAGLVIGCAAALPALTLPSSTPWLAALAYVLLLAWITRGLHWDGLADLADACGSNAEGERFWDIMKDSRIGAFGVMALVFGICSQTIAAYYCLVQGNVLALFLAPVFGRGAAIALGRLSGPSQRSTLGMLVHPGTRSIAALISLSVTVLAAPVVLGLASGLTAILMAALCLFPITRIAAKHGGINGDFLGTAILTAETALLLAGGAV